ncbi:MAG: PHP domain-containing protein, partial [Clostridia bacterium]
MLQNFLDRFKRYKPTQKEIKTLGSLTDFSLKIDKENKAIFCEAYFDKFKEFSDLNTIEDNIAKAYEIKSFRFYPHYDGSIFCIDCLDSLVESLNKYYISSIGKGFLNKYRAKLDDKTIVITLDDGLEASLLYESGVDEFLHDAIKCQFELDISFKFIGEAIINAESETQRIFREKSQEAHIKFVSEQKYSRPETPEGCDNRALSPLNEDELYKKSNENPNIIKSGRITFDISEPKILFGNDRTYNIIPIREISESKRVSFVCKMFLLEEKESRDGEKNNYKMYVTDLDSSILTRFFVPTDEPIKLPSAPAYLLISGVASIDKFDGEIVVRASSIMQIKQVIRFDNAKEKRVELHLHTNMSANDALSEPGAVMERAEKWGMSAVAFTDHGNVQSFPEIMKVQKKHPNVKPIFGMEGYLVDDTARAVFGRVDESMKFSGGTFIIFDIETTGLSPATCGITEIGAVKYINGEVIDVFDTFVNPDMLIPSNITQLTGITNE